MRLAIIATLPALLWARSQSTPDQGTPVVTLPHTPHLLLSAQRLKRLKRDRERQTPRWANFADRIENEPDSPERGFELALFYAVTGDESKGREAVKWANAHPCEPRQLALIRDWCPTLVPQQWPKAACPGANNGALSSLRDQLFTNAAAGEDTEAELERDKNVLIEKLRAGDFENPKELYAAFEYLSAARSVERIDLREEDSQFFTSLPIELLLNVKPDAVEHPDWQTHIAALALVSLDPNLDSSQFLQAWAIEDRQTIREGQGVAYEFLWADPYLPGVGYQNLDPWLYDHDRGMLVGRSNWSARACWIRITPGNVQDELCPEGWQSKPLSLGRLTLIPKTEKCAKLPKRDGNESTILWKLPPRTNLTYIDGKTQQTTVADRSGMWRVPSNATVQACTATP